MNENQEPLCALDICNMALAKLGEPAIPGIDPNGSPAQRLCYMHYHPVRLEVLCAARWSFATKSVKLVCENAGEFRLPADTLRVLEVSDPAWTLRGRRIFCASSTIELTYIADEEDSTLFEPLFVEAFATRLACKLCIPLTSSSTKRQGLTEDWQNMDFSAKGGWE